ncbi:MAG: allophanate hydrolase subunit 1 [Candidatus Bathyarchaeia archaeon]
MFDKPRFTYGGDNYLVLEYSIDYELEANFRVNLMAETLRKANIRGVVEVIPSIIGLMVHYDPLLVPPEKLARELQDIHEELKKTAVAKIESRFIEIPVLFNDPWSTECQNHFKSYHNTGDVPNIKFVAKENGITIKEAIARLIKPQWWIVFIGFTPGLSWSAPIGMKKEEMLQVSKYTKPRTWTPVGSCSIGGVYLAIYSVTHPGGYQLFGRTPAPVVLYDERCNPEKPLKVFKDSPCLNKTTDRMRLKPIDMEEYQRIEAQVKDGTYDFYIRTQQLDVNEYFADPVEYMEKLEADIGYKYSLTSQVERVHNSLESAVS